MDYNILKSKDYLHSVGGMGCRLASDMGSTYKFSEYTNSVRLHMYAILKQKINRKDPNLYFSTREECPVSIEHLKTEM